ncbi:MAG: hypothetical protein C5B47_08895 [Verrucomicrobia bacterium]|nr:MAG: hypothetical protein C5B47_08895 [Verrucomicrobiota bacterium]
MRKPRSPSTAFRNRRTLLLDVKARRNTARKRRRARIFNFTWKVGLGVACMIVTWFGTQKLVTKFFYNNSEYNIRHFVLPAEEVLSNQEFFATTGLQTGMNIFTIDLAQARKALLTLPQIKDVRIERVLPDTLRIRAEAKKPVAWLVSEINGKDPYTAPDSFLLEQNGSFYRAPSYLISRYFSLPVIYGINRQLLAAGDHWAWEDLHQSLELLRLIAKRNDPRLALHSLDLSKGYCIKAHGSHQEVIIFSTEDFDEQLNRLQELLNFCDRSGKQIEYVNLFVHRNTPVRFSMTEAIPLQVDPHASSIP